MCKGSWPAGPEGLSSPLQETRRSPWQKRITILQLAAAQPHTGRRRNAANRMQSIRGKRKNKRWENTFSQPLFLSFSLCPWCCLSSLSTSCGNNFVRYDCMLHTGSRADGPGVGYRGCVSPCLVAHLVWFRLGPRRKSPSSAGKGRGMHTFCPAMDTVSTLSPVSCRMIFSTVKGRFPLGQSSSRVSPT